jgi:hypothetical protein
MKALKSYLKASLLVALLYTVSLASYSQPAPDYNFQTWSLLSGTDKAVGAVYRFSTVKTGVDAIVTITNAVNATLATLDQTGQGWNAAFQPNITVPSMKNGYVEFKIEFVTAGTFNLLSQAQVAATALDIDGYNFAANQKLYEYEQFDMGANSYVEYDFAGSDINVSFVGTAIKATNVGGVDYGSINLSQNVRFTVFKSGVTTIYVRSGANNLDVFNNVTRQRSFYFARFTYPNSTILLPASDLESFSGSTTKENNVQLNWKLAKNNSINKIEIERSAGNNVYENIHTALNTAATYIDNSAPAGTNFYRLKLYEENGKTWYSSIVKINTSENVVKTMKVFPAVCINTVTLSFASSNRSSATIRVSDNSGRILLTQTTPVNEGINSLSVNIGNRLQAGNYIITVDTGKERYVGKMIKAIY